MLPISLALQGVYSYQEEQFIDFEALTATGLFGIFGAVGSGKSTILEAISIALYGENDRLDSTNFWYNLLNLKSDKAAITFVFEYEKERYKFEARWRRNTKKFHDIPFKERNGYKWVSGEWIPVSSNAAEILGLSYDHFKRTIIIPQGKFREFLELKPKERRTMIKEVFDLQRFDLSEKINTHYKDTEARRLLLEGELRAYASADPGQLQAYHTTITALQTDLATTEYQLEKETTVLHSVTALHEKWLRLLALRNEAATAQQQLPAFVMRKEQLRTYITAQASFKGYLEQLTSLRNQYDRQQLQHQTLLQQLQDLHKQKATDDTQYLSVKDAYERLADKQRQVNDFDITVQLITAFQQKEHLQKRVLAGQDHIRHKKAAETTTTAAIQETKALLEQHTNHLLSYDLIQQLDEWILLREQYNGEVLKLREQIGRQEQNLQHTLLQFSPYPTQQENYTAQFEQQRQQLNTVLQDIRNEEQQLLIRSELQQYAKALEEGNPCPLCGATTHPHILHAEELSPQLAAIRAKSEACREAEHTLETHWKKCDKLYTEANGYRKHLQELQQDLSVANTSLAQHESSYAFDSIPKNTLQNYPDLKRVFFANEKKQQLLRDQLEKLTLEAEQHRQNLMKFEEGVTTIEKQIAAIDAAIAIHFSNIAAIDANYYIHQGLPAVQHQKAIITEQIAQTENRYRELTIVLNRLEQEIGKTAGLLEHLETAMIQSQQEIGILETQLQTILQKSGFKDLETVRTILEQDLDIEQEQHILDTFFQGHNTLQSALQELETLLKGQTMDHTVLSSQQNTVALLQQEKDRLVGTLSATSEQASLLARQLQEQQALQKAYDTIAERTAHLDTLRKLFMGDKFIEFVSRTYLVQLCSYANERFHRLTRHQLSLQLNEQHEFEIIDYLNGGKPRSIKTLSGGQAFQAALCMALALAESVQAKSRQERNFFFIDEGFGTQDKATLHTVFETLDSLRKENRIVGIISHVEDLQENISRYIYVEKHDSRGSLISQF